MNRPLKRKRRFKIAPAFMDKLVDFCRAHPHIKAEQMMLVPAALAKDTK